jgi:hypothetical protein
VSQFLAGSDTKNEIALTFWMPYSWITDFTTTRDFWMIELKAKDEERPIQSKL